MRLIKLTKTVLPLLALLLIFSCKKGETGGEKLQITATINPYYLLAKEIVGDKMDVHLFIPADASPHTFSPKMSDLKKLESSSLIIANGLHLEEQLYEKLHSVEERVLIVADSIPESGLLANDGHHGDEKEHEGGSHHDDEEHHEGEEHHADEEHHEGEEHHADEEHHEGEEHHADEEHHEGEEHHHGPVDPHIWFSIDNLIKTAEVITAAVSRLDPASEAYYKERLEKVKAGLHAVDQKIKLERASFKSASIITYHNSFGYFLDRYKIELVTVIEESPGSSPSPKSLIETGKMIKEHGVNVIFIEPQLNPKGANIIAKEFNISVDTLDPLGFSVGAENSAAILWNNWEVMKKHFK